MNAPMMALGTMYFGTTVDEPTAFAILDRYADLGGAWVDTSDNYSFWTADTGFGGQSEALLGRWLAANPGVPVRLSTKVGAQPTRVGGFPDHVEGLGEDAVRAALAGSLERLGRDAVDLYWAHVEDPSVPLDELVATFGGMDVEGQPIPLGMLSPDGLDFLRRNPAIDGWVYTATLRGRYDRDDRPLEPEYRHLGTDRRRTALARVAEARGLRPGQVVLAWLASGSPALTPIVGVSSVEQLEQAVAGASTALTDQELAVLEAA
jgi:aryl-alcohol dehydrogenase-like predicted oxidoreductase